MFFIILLLLGVTNCIPAKQGTINNLMCFLYSCCTVFLVLKATLCWAQKSALNEVNNKYVYKNSSIPFMSHPVFKNTKDMMFTWSVYNIQIGIHFSLDQLERGRKPWHRGVKKTHTHRPATGSPQPGCNPNLPLRNTIKSKLKIWRPRKEVRAERTELTACATSKLDRKKTDPKNIRISLKREIAPRWFSNQVAKTIKAA